MNFSYCSIPQNLSFGTYSPTKKSVGALFYYSSRTCDHILVQMTPYRLCLLIREITFCCNLSLTTGIQFRSMSSFILCVIEKAVT
jgi:hypothetical protein